MIAYNADDVRLFGYLYHYPPTQGKQGEMLQVYEWDSGVSIAARSNGAHHVDNVCSNLSKYL